MADDVTLRERLDGADRFWVGKVSRGADVSSSGDGTELKPIFREQIIAFGEPELAAALQASSVAAPAGFDQGLLHNFRVVEAVNGFFAEVALRPAAGGRATTTTGVFAQPAAGSNAVKRRTAMRDAFAWTAGAFGHETLQSALDAIDISAL